MVPQVVESYVGFVLPKGAGCFASSGQVGAAGAGPGVVCQGAVLGVLLEVPRWLLAVLVWRCRQDSGSCLCLCRP